MFHSVPHLQEELTESLLPQKRRIADLLMCLALRLLLQPSWVGPSDPQRFSFILVGNKIDSDGGSKQMVLEKKAREWCASKGDIPYFETSAKEDHNVDTAFLCIARLALEHEHDQDIYFKTVAEQVPDTEQTSRCAC
uniref:Ras-related protein Rab7 n=1 Tax=Zea mays TaxID=4577 RepID=A0A804NAK4_MAIZE